MKALLLIASNGPLLILSSHESPLDDVFLGKLKAKGIEKFIAYDLDLELVKSRYGGHFTKVMQDLHETDDLRVLDYNGHRIFDLFRFDELGEQLMYDPATQKNKVYVD
jgi:hypothetical protein